jgi:hypothetical protein
MYEWTSVIFQNLPQIFPTNALSSRPTYFALSRPTLKMNTKNIVVTFLHLEHLDLSF